MIDFMTSDPLLRQFRLALYCSLLLAGACLIYAEWLLLARMPLVAGVFVAAMGVAFLMEDRRQLSIKEANIVGAGVALLVVVWLVAQLSWPADSMVQNLEFPSNLLALFGPPVLILMPTKLLRPKHLGDYWGFQVLALMVVTLGAALGGDGVYCLLLAAYLVSVVACLMRLEQLSSRSGDARPPAVVRRAAITWKRTLSTTALAGIAAIALVGITPRISESKWELPSESRLRTGISPDGGIDLNRSGELQPSQEVALRLRASYTDGRPKLDVSPTQRWRHSSYNFYERGKWSNRNWQRSLNRASPRSAPPKDQQPEPNLGRDQFTVEFDTPIGPTPVYVFCEPLWPGTRTDGPFLRAPIDSLDVDGRQYSWSSTREGELLPPLVNGIPLTKYRQRTAPLPEPGLSPPMEIDPALVQHLSVVQGLTGLRRYTDKLVREWQQTGKLIWTGQPGEDRLPRSLHEAAAKLFEEHLLASGQFQYSYSLDAAESGADPVEDFVLRQKRGHCNRFAAALAMMLRCQGIPSRMVMGYHGCDSSGDGSYVIRQSHAHSWVETIVERPTPDGRKTSHWLTLDPTPFVDAPETLTVNNWLGNAQRATGTFLREYLLDYDTGIRDSNAAGWSGWRPHEWKGWLWWLIPAVVAAIIVMIRRRPAVRRETPFEQIRTALGLGPAITGTEIIESTSSKAPAALSAVERIVAEHLARRFGGQAGQDMRAELRSALTAIESAARATKMTR